MVPLVDNSPQFVGQPIGEGQGGALFYESFSGPRISAKLGDAVRVSSHEGLAIGIIVALWSEGIRRKRNRCEVLLFDNLPEKKKREQELLLTPESLEQEIHKVQSIVQVKSHTQWQEESLKVQSKDKRKNKNVFFCEYGFMERTQTRTEAFDWDKLYTEHDRANLEDFQDRIISFIKQSAISKLSGRLQTKIKEQAARVVYITKSDDDAESDSEDQSDDTDAPQTRARRVRPQRRTKRAPESSVPDGPQTPRKRIKTGSKATQALRTPSKKPQTPKKSAASTPGGKGYRIHAPLEFTPLPSRIRNLADELNLSPHQLARQRLHVAEVPTSLPCREEEFASIYEQVESAILENESALIYVSGTPGTGKTATVREVITTLQHKVQEGELFPFKFVEINGMKIPDPTQAYSKLWETLMDQRVTASHALSLLQTEFTTTHSTRMPCVVLMDELDQLTTTKQEVMYNFFQWPNMPNTRLIVIAVANTMDLPERTLAHKVSSRLGLTRIAFAAYTRPQLREIIKSRLSNVESIDVDDAAIDYACLRVSRVSGDARRALDICRRAFELAEPGFTTNIATPSKKASKAQTTGRITMAIMQTAFTEMTSSPLQVYLKTLPFLSKIFLKAMLSCMRRTGLTETSLGEIVEDATRMCKVNTLTSLSLLMGVIQPVGVTSTARELAEGGVVYMETGKGERNARLRLKISESDILSSWSEDMELTKIS